MKCMSCGNMIPDGSTVCSYCNTPVNNGGSVIPQTPAAPVLPQDQNMQTGELQPAEPIETYVNPEAQAIPTVESVPVETAPVQPVAQPVQNVVQQPQVAQSAVVEAQTAPVQENPVVVPASQTVVMPVQETPVVTQQVVQPTAPVQPAVQQNVVAPAAPVIDNPNFTSNYIEPNGSASGEKIGSTAVKPVEKSKAPKIIILVVLIVLVISGGLGGYYYYSQYKTTDKRLTAVVNGVTSFFSSYTNDTIEKSSSSYVANINLSSGENNYTAELKGSYARDLSAKKIDVLMDLESLKNNDEDQISNPLNLEFYLADSNFYLLFENFTETYFYEPEFRIDDILTNIEQNDINYVTIISGLRTALNNGVKSMSSNISIESITVNEKNVKANTISVRLTKYNQERFINTFINSIKNNQTLLDELAKLYGLDSDKYLKMLEDYLENLELTDNNTTIYIYTKMFGTEFYGAKIDYYAFDESDNHYVIDLYKNGNGYGVSVDDDERNIFSGSYDKVVTASATAKESKYNIEFSKYQDEEATTCEIDLTLTTDVKPKEAKVVVRNSLQKEYVTEELKNDVLTKAQNIGPFGMIFIDRVNKYFEYDYWVFITGKEPVPEIADEQTPDEDPADQTEGEATEGEQTPTDPNTCPVDQVCN